MNEKPILFSTEMVRAILNGRKTQTRRVLKFDPTANMEYWEDPRPELIKFSNINNDPYWSVWVGDRAMDICKCPYGAVGDSLWVRETWAVHVCSHEKPSELYHPQRVWYKTEDDTTHQYRGKWRPSIFMPRWASRITLEVTNVKVQHLWEISEYDMNKEGVPSPSDNAGMHWVTPWVKLWDSINEDRGYGWETNPFVWVVEFKVVKA